MVMRARDLARPYPVLSPDADAAEAAHLLAREEIEAVFVAGDGGLAGVVHDAGLLRWLLPRYLDDDRILAGVLGEGAADELCRGLEGHRVADLLAEGSIPRIDGDANLVEVAEVLARTQASVVAVMQGRRLLGGITTSALIRRLLERP